MKTRLLGAVIAGVLLLSGCGANPAPTASPTAPPAAAPAPAEPKAGACYQMTMKQAVASTSQYATTRCNRAHTTETYHVGQLDTFVGGHLLAVDSDHVAAQVAASCRSRLPHFLKSSADRARLSMVQAVWFTPTVQQSDRGANWFRCDAVTVADSNSLLTSKTSLKGALAHSGRRSALAMCGTAAPSASNFRRVLCSAAHTWRAIAVVPVHGRRYPGVKAAKSAGQTRCQDAASAAAKNPLSFKWSYEWPTAQDWSLDQHYGICWTKAS